MTYWVYEDGATNRVRVHKATCNLCNHGRGMKGSFLPYNRWHSLFGTEREVIDRAPSTGRPGAKGCWFCLRIMVSLRYLTTNEPPTLAGQRLVGIGRDSSTCSLY